MKISKYLIPFTVTASSIITILVACESQKEHPYNPGKQFTVKQLQEDFLRLRKILERNHPTLHYFYGKESFDGIFDSTYALINNSMLVKDFYILLSQLVSKVNCGHTFLSLPNSYWENANKIFKYFPFKLYFQNGKAYVLGNYSRDSTIQLGAEILSVNNIPMSTIITNFFKCISADGLNQTYKYAKMNRIDYGLFPGYVAFPEYYDIKYKDVRDTVVKQMTIEARTDAEISEARKKLFPQAEEFTLYDFYVIDSLDTAVLTIRDFCASARNEYQGFLEDAFSSINHSAIWNLIIDVRDNDGGDPYNATNLLSYLTDSPYVYFPSHAYGYWRLKKPIQPHPLNFRGNRYVLMDGGCFSTTGHFLSIIKYHNLGILIGEESGGSYRCNGCVKDYVLSNTGIILHCTRCIYETKVKGFTWRRGITPDFEIRPTIEDLVNNKDTVMLFTLNLISKNMNLNSCAQQIVVR